MRRADVVAMHARLIGPDNAALIFAGDIDPKDAVALAAGGVRDVAAPAATALAPSRVNAAQPAAALAAGHRHAGRGPGRRGDWRRPPSRVPAPDYYAGIVANTVLGSGYSSRLNQEIRIKRGLSYGVSSQLDARRAGGVFAVSAQTKNDSAPEVVTVILDEVGRMSAAPPAPTSSMRASSSLIGGFSRSLETTEDLANRLAALEINGVDLAELGRAIGKMEQVTAADVQAFAKAHWRAGDLRIVVAGDAAQFVEGLRKTYPELLVIPQAEVDLDRRRSPRRLDVLLQLRNAQRLADHERAGQREEQHERVQLSTARAPTRRRTDLRRRSGLATPRTRAPRSAPRWSESACLQSTRPCRCALGQLLRRHVEARETAHAAAHEIDEHDPVPAAA